MKDMAVCPAFFAKYVELCWSPLRDTNTINEELIELLENPLVSHVAFYDDDCGLDDTLMVGTRSIIVYDSVYEVHRYLGKFIIYLTRCRIDRHWSVEFNLVNIDSRPMLHEVDDVTGESWVSKEYPNPHPHMTTAEHLIFGTVAKICIGSGRFQILQHLRKGELHHATTRIIDLLHTLGPDSAYLEVQYWPEYNPEEHE